MLAGAGPDVVVLEAGAYLDDADFDGAELDGYARLYLGAAAWPPSTRASGSTRGVPGRGTVVNFSTRFPTPDDVRAEWARLGVAAMISQDYTAALECGVGPPGRHDRPQPAVPSRAGHESGPGGARVAHRPDAPQRPRVRREGVRLGSPAD